MNLTCMLSEHVRACFTGLWIESSEPDEALREIALLCREQSWPLLTWDAARGLQGITQNAENSHGTTDPMEALRSVQGVADGQRPSLLLLSNLHHLLGSIELIEELRYAIEEGKHRRTFVIILAPIVRIPPELEKLFVVIEHALPCREQLEEIARQTATEADELPEGSELTRLLDASAGLTRYEAEGAYALSLVRYGRLQSDVLWELKAQSLKSGGALRLYRGSETFETLGGLGALKTFCRRSLLLNGRHDSASSGSGNPDARPRGVMLLGVPGTGKSAFCKALGAETGRPTLVLDIGALMGSLVGQTEANLRRALKQIDAMSPCVVMIDEVEKALSGSGGQQDSGVSSRLFGTLLTWLNDRTSDSYVVCTCNDISRLPPEFARAERFDGVWFIDLPSNEQRQSIWNIYRAQYDIQSASMPDDGGWTGAEIKACCRLARLLDMPLAEAARHVVPIADTAAESVDKLRTWAAARCLSAETGSVYRPV